MNNLSSSPPRMCSAMQHQKTKTSYYFKGVSYEVRVSYNTRTAATETDGRDGTRHGEEDEVASVLLGRKQDVL